MLHFKLKSALQYLRFGFYPFDAAHVIAAGLWGVYVQCQNRIFKDFIDLHDFNVYSLT